MPKKQSTKKQEPETQSTEVVNWEEQMAREAREVAKTERASVNKINFRSGVMTYMDNAITDNTLDCIVVASVAEHVYYTEKWKANDIKPPACFALGDPGLPLIPHEAVPNPQADGCDECPMFKWGSDPEGGRGKACSERRRLAVIPSPEGVEDVKDSDMAVMSIPVMSVKNWANYVNKVAATLQRPPWGVLTRVRLIPDGKSQFKVLFDAVEVLSSEYLPHVQQRINIAENALMTPYEMNPEPKQEQQPEGDTKY